MKTNSMAYRALWLLTASLLLATGVAAAAEVKVMISGGFSEAYNNVVPEFERVTRNTVTTVRGPSMGATPQAIPNRLQRGEPADVVIMVGEALDELIKQQKV